MTRSLPSVAVVVVVAALPSAVILNTPRSSLAADQPQAATNDAVSDVAATIRRAFVDLADANADVREAARSTLMGLDRRYLPDLRKLVEQSRPLRPAQATALRQIVTDVYLSGEAYEAEPHAGFLGLRAQQIAISSTDVSAGEETAGAAAAGTGGAGAGAAATTVAVPKIGMVVVYRLPGFVAHRVLLDGDVILGFVERPKVTFEDREEFNRTVKAIGPGETFHLNVLRRGRVVKIEVTLDRRPKIVNDEFAVTGFEHDRHERAEAYWRKDFAPLLPETLD